MDFKKKCAVKFSRSPFHSFFFFFLYFSFILLLPRNDSVPVNPHRTFPVWQQAVSPSFTFVLKTAGLGKIRLNFTLQGVPLIGSAR